MLKDLNKLIVECRERFDTLPSKSDILLNDALKEVLHEALNKAESSSSFELNAHSITLTNNKGLRADLPSTWLWYGYAFRDLKEALNEYKNFVSDAKDYLKDKRHSTADINNLLKTFPGDNSLTPATPIVTDLIGFINGNYSAEEEKLIREFLTNRDWWFIPLTPSEQVKGKTLERGDIFNSSLYLAARVIVANSDRLTVVTEAFVVSNRLYEYFDKFVKSGSSSAETAFSSIQGNFIFYGAPGTGKSHRIEKEIVGSNKHIRTVFHPDTQYADFVGSLKPHTSVSSSGEPIITYDFRAGPFTKAFIEAVQLQDTGKPVYLIIEEINRASAAAVFGELFQLLDRKADGSSEYDIDVSDPDMLAYINDKLTTPVSTLSLPANLILLATMNSSDQAVKPMDTAFKRRWSFEYMHINYSKATPGKFVIPLNDGLNADIEWRDFAEVVNNRLQSLSVPEDRLLGHRFLSESELSSGENAANALCGKLFVYLWDDVLRHGRRDVIFNTDVANTFGSLVNGYKNGQPVFSDELEEELMARLTSASDEVEAESDTVDE